MKRLPLVMAFVLSALSPTANAQNLGDELLKSIGQALRQSLEAAQQGQGQQPQAGAPQQQTSSPSPQPSGSRVVWQVQPRGSGMQDVIGHVPPSYDLANPEVAARVYLEGCRVGGGGGSWFGDINAYQNGQLVAQGNLRGCDAGNVRSNFRKNIAVANRAKADEKAAHMQARETMQNIGNTRGLDGELLKELNAEVVRIKSHPTCRQGCKDFQVGCQLPGKLSRADRANGIEGEHIVELDYLRFGGAALPGGMVIGSDKRWHEETLRITFTKSSGNWKQAGSSSMRSETWCRRDR